MVSFLAKAIAKANTIAVSVAQHEAIPPEKLSEPNWLSKLKKHVPVRGAFEVGKATGKVVLSVTEPLPWIGPVAKLVSEIVEICQNVSVNKYSSCTIIITRDTLISLPFQACC